MLVNIHDLDGVGGHVVCIHGWQGIFKANLIHEQSITVQLKHAEQSSISVIGIGPGMKGTFCDYVPDAQYLFTISGKGNAIVDIGFPTAASGPTRAEIIICKTPSQTVL